MSYIQEYHCNMCMHNQHTCTHMCTSIYTAPTPQHVLLRNLNVQFMITSYYSLFSGLNEFDDGETSNKPYHDFYKLHKESLGCGLYH